MITDQTAQIYKRLDAHSERLNKVEKAVSDIADISRKIANYGAQGEKTYHYLFGNGDVGLDERVRNIEKKLGDMIGIFKWVAIVVGGYVLVELVKLVLTHL